MSIAGEKQAFAALLDRVRSGDETAIGALVMRYEHRLRLTTRLLLGPELRRHLDSVDITQSVHRILLIGFRRGKFDFQSPAQFVSFLNTVARRKIARHWRNLGRPGPMVDNRSNISPVHEPEDGLPDPAHEAEIRDTMDHVLDGLTGIDRKLIELRFQGYRTVDVARETGIDARVLRARLSRLRERLRRRGLLKEWL